MNYLIVLEYRGTSYKGWQAQNVHSSAAAGKTVEGEISRAISIVSGFFPKLLVSGRTDAGVHALNQVANFELPFLLNLEKFRLSLNGILPRDISVKSVEIIHDSFHATRDVVSKTYLYKINHGFESPLLSGLSWFVKDGLNLGLMLEASAVFKGRHDFSNFSKIDAERRGGNNFRTITNLNISGVSGGFDILVEGEGFLRHMVRRIVGSIILCGTGKFKASEVSRMLAEKAPSGGNNVLQAPSCGLFLYSVRYPHKIYY